VPIAPSNVPEIAEEPRRDMTNEDIQTVVKAFAAAARRVQSAGFDGKYRACFDPGDLSGGSIANKLILSTSSVLPKIFYLPIHDLPRDFDLSLVLG